MVQIHGGHCRGRQAGTTHHVTRNAVLHWVIKTGTKNTELQKKNCIILVQEFKVNFNSILCFFLYFIINKVFTVINVVSTCCKVFRHPKSRLIWAINNDQILTALEFTASVAYLEI